MKIENFPTKDYNMNVSGEPQTKTVNAQSLSDVVSFGSKFLKNPIYFLIPFTRIPHPKSETFSEYSTQI